MKLFCGGAAAAVAILVLVVGCGKVTPVDSPDGGGGSAGGSGGAGQGGAGAGGASPTGTGGAGQGGAGAGGASPTGTGGAEATGAGGASATGAGGHAGSGAGGSGGTSTNLVPNGDFSAPGNDWHVFDQVTQVDTPGDSSTGQLCYTSSSGSAFAASITMGWPVTLSNVAMLASSGSYTFSYSASFTGPGPVTMFAKVGSATSPLVSSVGWTDPVTTMPMTFVHQFPGTGDSHTGIAFNVTLGAGTTICVDNIVLMRD
jgi:hypothetical protein